MVVIGRLLFFASVFLTALSFSTAQQRLHFKPLLANPLESRIGTLYEASENRLRLDIGASTDLVSIYQTEEKKLTLGTDFFTLTRLRSEGNLKFPVETSDYFFGLNSCLSFDKFTKVRARLAHISSHLVDGLANENAVLNPKPFVYSREFLDVVITREFDLVRPYLGLNYVFSNRALYKEVPLLIAQAGFDSKVAINESFSFSSGMDLKTGLDVSGFTVVAAQAGIEVKLDYNTSLFIGAHYYNGTSIHGMFFDTNDEYLGYGFQVYF